MSPLKIFCNVLPSSVSYRQVMVMVKLRWAKYCNVKLFLIFLVVYGHLIEPKIGQSQVLMLQYKMIYLFHMPLFSFLSGLFLKNGEACKRQMCRMLSLYLVLQTLAVVLGGGKVKPLTPYWHLWYLLSCGIWSALGWALYRLPTKGKYCMLILWVMAGCFVGYVPGVGRVFSLSRTVVFFPYFWLGMLTDSEISWDSFRLPAFWGAVGAIALFLCLENRISATFLYHATPYTRTWEQTVRLLCYLAGGLLCFAILTFMPGKRFFFTKAGADTLPAYLLHAPVVLHIRKLNIFWPFYILITAVTLYAVWKLTRWHGRLYGILPQKTGRRR